MANENIYNLTNDFVIVWLDNSIEKTQDGRNTKALLRQLARGHLLTYDDLDKCIDDITDEPPTKQIFLIVSNTFGQHVVPLISEILSIQGIYIFCGDQKKAQAWAAPYSKISGIFTTKYPLLNKIGNDIGVYDKDEDFPMNVFHLAERQHTLQQLTKESRTFMWYRLILKVLRLMAKYGNSKHEMIAESRAASHDNESVKKKIDDFEKNYDSTRACWWYTKDSFVYRLLNKALRTQNIEIIFKFRFFINDLQHQIEELYQRYLEAHSAIITHHHLTVYRGQRLCMEELGMFKSSVNDLISMNSFLSATVNQDIAKIFAGTNDQLNKPSSKQTVLFKIDICNMSKEMTPFAFIQNYSSCPDEEEVLFSIGAIFKVQSVEQRANMWHIHLQLSKEENEISQNLSEHMMKQIGSEPDPLSFGWFLFRMNKFDEAERYAKYMLTQLPSKDKAIGNAYNLLGLMYKATHKLEESVAYYEKALEIYSQMNCHDSPQIIAIHCNLGLVHLELGDSRNAEEQQREAEEKLFNSSQSKNSLLIATVESLKAKIETEYGDNINALKNLELVLKRKQEQLPSVHASIASTMNEIGKVQEKLDNDVKALEYFQKALEIGNISLPPDHLDLVDYHTNIGRIYNKQKQFKLALEQFELALKIMEDFPREETDRIENLEKYIIETKKKLRRP
ncbi:unnamed protein product [Rotaria sp. Silwood1]|nr:unnamed protein product [Rotaria sp. Silwood1]CAF1427541.1 unnamed protein product [Rotaria sp. Silwood1]CAF3594673.1 unnamed protein product [Rotaria sp. Silwood1]CAF4533041.1 unnamed protein product [Rotaria sp. Silwood1]CAF4643408.1 unnamed protein product [Rotaria sp. Silwood1]